MEHDLDSARGGVYTLVAPQLAFHDLDLVGELGEVRAIAGREIVEDANFVAALDQGAGEVRPDEAPAAGDKDLHVERGVYRLRASWYIEEPRGRRKLSTTASGLFTGP